MKIRPLPSILIALAGAFTHTGVAQPAYLPYPERETIELRSALGHGGSASWVMKKADQASDAAAISAPGFAADGWQKAVVPGTVLNSLVTNGVYPEPYFGVNNKRDEKKIPDISEVGSAFYTYWFRTKFNVPKSFDGRRAWLQFDGINYLADIWVNGKQVGAMGGMFKRGLFDVTDAVKAGSENALAVLVHPIDPPNGFKPPKVKDGKAKNENQNGADGAIGKYTTMLMTAGWDFTFKDGIRDRNTGIWRAVKLFATGPVILGNPFVVSKLPLPSLASSEESISVDLTNATDKPQVGTLTAAIPETKLSISQPVTLNPKETRKVTFTPDRFATLKFSNPRLWWPFNKGEQFLHHLNLSFKQEDVLSDKLTTRFGIRDIRSDRNTPDQSRIFYVNGQRLFLHGTNWIPEAMQRTSLERTEAELRYTRQAGINFIRFWAGGVTESDEYFDLCDQLGIFNWVEFWQTGNTALPVDKELYRANVKDTVNRIRNHASLAYYVSANERDARGIVPIQDILKDLDPTHGYQPGSETDGVHDGSPYGSGNPMWYYEDTGSDRGSRINGLCPEYGTPCLPTVDALREMMPASDLWPINKATWDYLDGDGFHGMTRLYQTAVRQYGVSSNIDEYAFRGQMFGSLAYKAIWECWNANRFEFGDRFSTGVLFWYHNCPHPQTCARLYDYSLEPTAALYSSQNAHEPLHIQYDFLKNTLGVNNELPKAFANLTATIRILNFDMKEAYRNSVTIDVPADRFVKAILKVTLPEDLTPVYFLKLTLTDAVGKVLSNNFYWSSNKTYTPGRTLTGPLFQGMSHLSSLPKTTVESQVFQSKSNGNNIYRVTVSNPSPTIAFMIWLRLQDTKTGKPIRPAFYDDNFYSLLPGESRTVNIEYSGTIDPTQTRIIVDGWNIARKQYENGKVTDLPDIRTTRPLSLAQGKPATASSSAEGTTPEAVTDLDSASRWASNRTDNQWIAIDLGTPTKFSSVGLAWETAYATDYQIQVSDDSTTWKDVLHITDGKGGEVLLKFDSVVARYVRMLGNKRPGRYGFSLFDFAVYP